VDQSAHADAIKTALAEAVSSGKIFDRNSWDMCDSEEAIKHGKGYQFDIFLQLYPIMHFDAQVGSTNSSSCHHRFIVQILHYPVTMSQFIFCICSFYFCHKSNEATYESR
jgi:hypothetical protein